MPEYILVTSNEAKLQEYRAMGLPFAVEPGRDLPEVDADPLTVALYKALAAGPGRVVEDAILTMNGQELIDVRWRVDELVTDMQAIDPVVEWWVTLGHHTGTEIRLYQGKVICRVDPTVTVGQVPDDAFAFDPYLIPDGETRTFYTLATLGLKAQHSPRVRAVQALMNDTPVLTRAVADIPVWTGPYQHG